MSRFETARYRLTGAADTLRQKASETRDVAQEKFDSAAGTAREHVLQAAPEPVKRVAGQARERASDLWSNIPSRSANKDDRNAGAQALSQREKQWLCHELVALAVIDGNLHPHEISSLYLLFTTMDLDLDTRQEVRNLLGRVSHT